MGIRKRRLRFDEAMIKYAGISTSTWWALRGSHSIGLPRFFGEAISTLPLSQRRHRTADLRPVRRIAEGLLKGWLDAQGASKPLPAYMLRESSSPSSPFRKIVIICYRAIGLDLDPERAIKAYIRWGKERDRETSHSRRNSS